MAHIQTIQRSNGKSYKAIIKQGDRVLKTKTFRTKTLAKQWVKAIEADRANVRALGLKGAKMSFNQLADEYNRQWAGRDTYRVNRVTWWKHQLGHKKVTDITTDEILGVLDKYAAGKALRGNRSTAVKIKATNRTRTPASVNQQRAALSAVFKYAMDPARKYANSNPVHEVPIRTENNKRTRYLSDLERKALLNACRESAWSKLYLLVLMAICTGARKSEMLNVRWSDIDFKRRIASVRMTKNGDPRELPLPVVVIQELLRHREVGNGLVFGSTIRIGQPFEYKKHWTAALKTSGLLHPVGHPKYFRFHDLRHTAASYLVQNGATLYETGEVLGHKSLETTKRYAHLDTSRKREVTDRVFGSIFNEVN